MSATMSHKNQMSEFKIQMRIEEARRFNVLPAIIAVLVIPSCFDEDL
jgi:hypothetical protein